LLQQKVIYAEWKYLCQLSVWNNLEQLHRRH
jgi:hypothetical protein